MTADEVRHLSERLATVEKALKQHIEDHKVIEGQVTEILTGIKFLRWFMTAAGPTAFGIWLLEKLFN